jgi:hypothetical protein
VFHSPAAVDAVKPPAATPAPIPGGLLACPGSKPVRERLRAMASDLVASWRSEGMPPAAKTAAGLRGQAAVLAARAGADPEHVGWTMVTIVSEYWREKLASGASGRRLLLLPDCPAAAAAPEGASSAPLPRVCGTGCAIGTIWSAARDSGWVVESTGSAVSAIGALLTGQYDGILGVAKLAHLEKAFAMLPAFSLPIAAVPYDPSACTAQPAAWIVDYGSPGTGWARPTR